MTGNHVQLVGQFRHFQQRRRYAPATITKRCAIVRRWLSHADDWRAVTWRDVELWLTDPAWHLSATAQRDARSHLRAFYWWAGREGLCDRDPTQHVLLPRTPRRVPRPATEGQVLLALHGSAPDIAGMVALMAGAGLRCCEVAGLTWSAVDLVGRQLWIQGKGGHERCVPLSSDVARYLAASDSGRRHVFVNAAGRPYTATRVSQLVNGQQRRLGQSVTAHQFRHRYATAALAACGDLSVVAALLGHVSTATTEGYAAVAAATTQRAGLAITLPVTR
jgi:integrase/recombinase XerD